MDVLNYEYNQHVKRLQSIRAKSQVKNMTDEKTCDICGFPESKQGEVKPFMTFNMCPECTKHEKALQAQIKNTEHERLAKLTVNASRKVDDNVRYNGDVFNAATVAIVDLEKIINLDASIPADQKLFMLAKEIGDRIAGNAKKIFELKTEVNNLETTQVVHQRRLNELAEKLTTEERAKLKIIAINYKPQLSKDKPGVKIPKLGPKSENLSLVLKDFPKMNIDDAKLAALYLDKMNRKAQVMTTADAVAFVNSTK